MSCLESIARRHGRLTACVLERALAMAYLWVAIGGAVGSMARYGMSGFIAALTGGTFPYGTLAVTVPGALSIGFLATSTGPDTRFFIPASGRVFLMVGICGGY